MIIANSDKGYPVHITHLVLEGFSQWVIGRNITQKANLQHLGNNEIMFYVNGEPDSLTLLDHEFLSHMKLSSFTGIKNPATICGNSSLLNKKHWHDLKKVIDKMHKHVCGHAIFTNFRLLLHRNNM